MNHIEDASSPYEVPATASPISPDESQDKPQDKTQGTSQNSTNSPEIKAAVLRAIVDSGILNGERYRKIEEIREATPEIRQREFGTTNMIEARLPHNCYALAFPHGERLALNVIAIPEELNGRTVKTPVQAENLRGNNFESKLFAALVDYARANGMKRITSDCIQKVSDLQAIMEICGPDLVQIFEGNFINSKPADIKYALSKCDYHYPFRVEIDITKLPAATKERSN